MRNKLFIAILALCATFGVQAQEMYNYPLDTVNGEEVYRYEVERSIGLYRIGVNFNVSQNEIVRMNPQLKERGLHYGETLLIPTGRPVIIETKPELIQTTITETVVLPVNTSTNDTVELQDSLTVPNTIVPDTRHVVELALLLPFESQQTKRSGNAERMMEFYQGALLALKDLQNDSTLYRLRVYDSERSERRVKALCDSSELDNVKGILGLVYPIQIERMAQWCDTHHVALLLPFSDDMDLSTHPHVLQFNATDRQEADSLCQWIIERDSLIHCAAIDVREAEMSPSIRTLRKQMKTHAIPCSGIVLRDLMLDSAAYALDSAKENLILLHSDRYQQIRLILPHLVKLQEAGFRIRLISQYSWQKESISLPQVYTSMFTVNEGREAYDDAWKQFFTIGHVSEAPRYDLLGYDLMRALVEWLNGRQESKGLQADIQWTQVKNGGYQNSCVKVIAY